MPLSPRPFPGDWQGNTPFLASVQESASKAPTRRTAALAIGVASLFPAEGR
jgi:hypothetical protein